MVIFDTNILIELYRGNVKVRKIELLDSNIFYISSITVAEFLVGSKNKADLKRMEKQLSKYTVIPMGYGYLGNFS